RPAMSKRSASNGCPNTTLIVTFFRELFVARLALWLKELTSRYDFQFNRGMKKLGDAIRRLMEAKEITGIQLASDIGLTATSISRILNDASRPRQVTLTVLFQQIVDDLLLFSAHPTKGEAQ